LNPTFDSTSSLIEELGYNHMPVFKELEEREVDDFISIWELTDPNRPA